MQKLKETELSLKWVKRDFPGGTVERGPCAYARNTSLIPGPEKSHMPQSMGHMGHNAEPMP